jgi:hypothetical protein
MSACVLCLLYNTNRSTLGISSVAGQGSVTGSERRAFVTQRYVPRMCCNHDMTEQYICQFVEHTQSCCYPRCLLQPCYNEHLTKQCAYCTCCSSRHADTLSQHYQLIATVTTLNTTETLMCVQVSDARCRAYRAAISQYISTLNNSSSSKLATAAAAKAEEAACVWCQQLRQWHQRQQQRCSN